MQNFQELYKVIDFKMLSLVMILQILMITIAKKILQNLFNKKHRRNQIFLWLAQNINQNQQQENSQCMNLEVEEIFVGQRLII